MKRSPRSSPAPGASVSQLAEGGPRDAAWAAGSGATDCPALAVGGRIRPTRAAVAMQFFLQSLEEQLQEQL